jgi:hypothetical protein
VSLVLTGDYMLMLADERCSAFGLRVILAAEFGMSVYWPIVTKGKIGSEPWVKAVARAQLVAAYCGVHLQYDTCQCSSTIHRGIHL